ncbi:MFS transporter [Streptomyces nigrescens]|uniref:hypothetical protein n=1 Tax=Streptomyces nigrescens TaxID=1920 RepID=UPI00225AF2F7|nr:hypothetical protein [Streptomyces libani]
MTIGVTGATVLAAVLTSVMSNEAMASWGWRVPFLAGGALGVYAIWLRRSLDESPAYEKEQRQEETGSRPSMWRGIWENRVAALKVIGLTVGGTVAYYTWAVSATGYAISVKGVDGLFEVRPGAGRGACLLHQPLPALQEAQEDRVDDPAGEPLVTERDGLPARRISASEATPTLTPAASPRLARRTASGAKTRTAVAITRAPMSRLDKSALPSIRRH